MDQDSFRTRRPKGAFLFIHMQGNSRISSKYSKSEGMKNKVILEVLMMSIK